ncbi:GNAT family N-acetyltransferase [Amphibacillus sp. Q70]|uniref:GNAT family N-acetyltransferase n=1 Tax=Amphibacillus sp. Q70 TaxID=3453416 RepID=UPI003F836C2B
MDIKVISHIQKPIKATELMNLYHNAGWWDERKEQDIDKMLSKVISVGAWKDDELVGFSRAVTDGKFRAYIEDVVVHKEFQCEGIGLKLVSNLLKELSHIDVISLFCEEQLIPFYEKNAFKHSPSQFIMHRKKPT